LVWRKSGEQTGFSDRAMTFYSISCTLGARSLSRGVRLGKRYVLVQSSLSTGSMPSETPHVRASGPGILLALAWLYFRYLGGHSWWFPLFSPMRVGGAWEWLYDGSGSVSVILIPLYLAHCVAATSRPHGSDLAALGGAHDVCFDAWPSC